MRACALFLNPRYLSIIAFALFIKPTILKSPTVCLPLTRLHRSQPSPLPLFPLCAHTYSSSHTAGLWLVEWGHMVPSCWGRCQRPQNGLQFAVFWSRLCGNGWKLDFFQCILGHIPGNIVLDIRKFLDGYNLVHWNVSTFEVELMQF